MKGLLESFYTKPLVIYLALALLAISTAVGPAEAMFISAVPQGGSTGAATETSVRTADLIKIRSALESKIIGQRLMDHGLTPDEAMARVNMLSDDQIHQLASHTDSLQAGGDAVGVLASLVIIALLVVLLIYLVQGRVVIK